MQRSRHLIRALFACADCPLGEDIQTVLSQTGVQQFFLDPLPGLVGTFRGMLTS
jgi:hypothetical protein